MDDTKYNPKQRSLCGTYGVVVDMSDNQPFKHARAWGYSKSSRGRSSPTRELAHRLWSSHSYLLDDSYRTKRVIGVSRDETAVKLVRIDGVWGSMWTASLAKTPKFPLHDVDMASRLLHGYYQNAYLEYVQKIRRHYHGSKSQKQKCHEPKCAKSSAVISHWAIHRFPSSRQSSKGLSAMKEQTHHRSGRIPKIPYPGKPR